MKQLLIATIFLALPILCSAQTGFMIKFGDIQGNIPFGEFSSYHKVDNFEQTFYRETNGRNEPSSDLKYTGVKITKPVDAITAQIQSQFGRQMTVLAIARNGSQTVMKYTMNQVFVISQRIYTSDAGILMEEIVLAPRSVISASGTSEAEYENMYSRAPSY